MTTKTQAAARPALLGKEAIKKDQDGIRKNLLNLDQSIHANAVQCMMHAAEHGDTSLMRRLLVEVIDAKTGYRRQGLINWMRKHSPMELTGDNINLSGTDPATGEKRPFLIDEAIATPFWSDADNAERVAKPVFQDTALSPMDRVIRDILAAAENTANGKPVDPSKPFYDGVHMDKIVDFVQEVKALKAKLPQDSTREVRLAQQRIAKDEAFVRSSTGDRVEEPSGTHAKSPVPAKEAA